MVIVFFLQQMLTVVNYDACKLYIISYTTLIQLCSNGFHQHRHRGGRACDVGGACVDHSCAAFSTKHHLLPDRNSERIKEEVESKTDVV